MKVKIKNKEITIPEFNSDVGDFPVIYYLDKDTPIWLMKEEFYSIRIMVRGVTVWYGDYNKESYDEAVKWFIDYANITKPDKLVFVGKLSKLFRSYNLFDVTGLRYYQDKLGNEFVRILRYDEYKDISVSMDSYQAILDDIRRNLNE